MRWMTQRGIAAVILAVNAFACGTDNTVDNRPVECMSLNDCAVDLNECRKVLACEEGKCVFENAPDGWLLGEQTTGDCMAVVCDGMGKTRLIAAEIDVPDDGNECTVDTCDGMKPRQETLPSIPCYTGPVATEGVGNCQGGIRQCAGASPIGECIGEVIPNKEICDGTLDDEDCDGVANEEGAGCACLPGAEAACYAGPSNTAGIGICREGVMICQSSGLEYGTCVGEIMPQSEVCEAMGLDEDCDGLINEEGDGCFCGDGFIQTILGEECDDGNSDSSDSCTAACKQATCGDGVVQPGLGEECDDANQDQTDGCIASCKLPICGDAIMQWGESCDDGNTFDVDECPANCVHAVAQIGTGFAFTCATFEDGRAKCWGRNYLGQLGLGDTVTRGDGPDEMGHALPTVQLGANALVIRGGLTHTCALLQGGLVKCWGGNYSGELGLGDTLTRGDGPGEMGISLPFVDLGGAVYVQDITIGQHHSCALTQTGTVKCWGQDWRGQIGLETADARGNAPGEMGDNLPFVDLGAGNTVTAVDAGRDHTCALLDGGAIKCWGFNLSGQLGLGDDLTRGNAPGQMGDNLPVVDLGVGKVAIAIAAGGSHACAILAGGSVKCWGYNGFGQLGLGDTFNRGDQPGELGDNLPTVDLGAGNIAVAITAGDEFSCALLKGGIVKCWGYNFHGNLGLGDTIYRGDNPGEMGDSLPTVDLGAGKFAVAITAGEYHTCVLLQDNSIKCWGEGAYDHGQLGLGDTKNHGDEPNEMGDQLPEVSLW